MIAPDTIDVRLKQDHDALRDLMQRFAIAMQNSESADRTALLRDRVAFSRLFARHTLEEQKSITALRLTPLPPAVAMAIKVYETGLQTLRLDYSAHISLWKPDDMARDERGYADAVLSLQRRLKDYMTFEEAMIFPLLARMRPAA